MKSKYVFAIGLSLLLVNAGCGGDKGRSTLRKKLNNEYENAIQKYQEMVQDSVLNNAIYEKTAYVY
jgi:hypothetical protein